VTTDVAREAMGDESALTAAAAASGDTAEDIRRVESAMAAASEFFRARAIMGLPAAALALVNGGHDRQVVHDLLGGLRLARAAVAADDDALRALGDEQGAVGVGGHAEDVRLEGEAQRAVEVLLRDLVGVDRRLGAVLALLEDVLEGVHRDDDAAHVAVYPPPQPPRAQLLADARHVVRSWDLRGWWCDGWMDG
jgi:hypothetical protein